MFSEGILTHVWFGSRHRCRQLLTGQPGRYVEVCYVNVAWNKTETGKLEKFLVRCCILPSKKKKKMKEKQKKKKKKKKKKKNRKEIKKLNLEPRNEATISINKH